MTFRKLQRFLAAGMVTTMTATTVLGAAPIDISKAASKLTTDSIATKADTIGGVSADDEGVYKVTMDETGYITADEENVAADVNTPFSWDNANVYFVLTDRFYNGDKSNDHSYGRSTKEKDADKYETRVGTFHGGDLKGLTQKLEEGYFDKLGTNAIWISAPYEQIHGAMCGNQFKHYAYHGYYVLDYTNVDENMGTAEDLQKFVDTAHEHGIRVIFDIVMNHAGYADAYTANEYGFGKLSGNWEETYYNKSETSYSWKDDYAEYGGMMVADQSWQKGWWGTNWLRAVEKNGDGSSRFPGYGGSESGDDLTICSSGLPDFKTESTAEVGLPDILNTKWKKEGVTAEKEKLVEDMFKRTGLQKNVTGYLVGWLSQWVYDYGIDGFRCDTAKHVDKGSWNKLYQACNKALKEWRKNNPDKAGAQWTDEFWMTGEAWGWSSMSPDSYFTEGGFTSMINFSYQGNENKTGASLDSVFSSYANSINTKDNFNVLSYISSHDKGLGARSANAGTALLLTPGGIQTFYGDESGRPAGAGNDYEPARSHMNWDSTNTKILSNWQKVGQFRRNHIAVGAGQHKKLDGDNYTFSRTYEGNATVGAEKVTDYKDAVVVCLPGKATTTDVTVGNTFGDATTVRDAYSGEIYDISGGVVSGVKCDDNGVILLELPTENVSTSSVNASPAGGTYKTDTVEVTLKAKDATETYYQIGDGEKIAYQDGDKLTIGGDTAYEEETVITLTGKGTDKDGNAVDLSKELKFTRDKEPVFKGVASDHFYIRVKKSDFTEAPKIWAYSGKTSYTGAEWASRPSMTEDGDYYVFESEEATGEVEFILTTEDGWRSTEDQKPGLTATGAVEYSKKDNATTEIPGEAVETGKVTINYIDYATDKVMKSIYRVGKLDDTYTTYESSFAGYTLTEKPENATGKFTKEEITVNYYYTNGDTPATKTPATEVPATETPATEVPATETPATEVPATETPATEVPATETPATEVPATETPATEVPATETPATEIPATKTPATEIPATPTPVPLGVKEITSSVNSPQILGSTITFKAAGQGGSGSYEYKFTVYRIVNAIKVPSLKQAYSTSDTLKWTPEIAGDYQIEVRVKDTKTNSTKTATAAYMIKAKSTGKGSEKLGINKFAIAHTTGKYAVKLSASASGGTGTKQYKFVRIYTSKGKVKYKTLKGFSTSKSTTWKAAKKGTYKFRVYVKDKKGLKVQVTKTFKIKN